MGGAAALLPINVDQSTVSGDHHCRKFLKKCYVLRGHTAAWPMTHGLQNGSAQ
jgi:hypothetical protein